MRHVKAETNAHTTAREVRAVLALQIVPLAEGEVEPNICSVYSGVCSSAVGRRA